MADFPLFLGRTLTKNKGSCKGRRHVHIFLMYLNTLKLIPAPIAYGITEGALEELVEKALT